MVARRLAAHAVVVRKPAVSVASSGANASSRCGNGSDAVAPPARKVHAAGLVLAATAAHVVNLARNVARKCVSASWSALSSCGNVSGAAAQGGRKLVANVSAAVGLALAASGRNVATVAVDRLVVSAATASREPEVVAARAPSVRGAEVANSNARAAALVPVVTARAEARDR